VLCIIKPAGEHYTKKAGDAKQELGKKFKGAQGGQAGLVEQYLCQYGKAGKVHETVLGTFGDASQGVSDLCDPAADALAHEHLRF
jgi:hypothetical protein